MKRTLIALLLSFLVIGGSAATASAGTNFGHGTSHQGGWHGGTQFPPSNPGSHQGGGPGTNPGGSHQCPTAVKCRPKPLPKPTHGWPCKPHCSHKHHYPICPPPIVAVPVPPILHNPPPKKHHKVTIPVVHKSTSNSGTPVLAFTASPNDDAKIAGLGLGMVGFGVLSLAGAAFLPKRKRT